MRPQKDTQIIDSNFVLHSNQSCQSWWCLWLFVWDGCFVLGAQSKISIWMFGCPCANVLLSLGCNSDVITQPCYVIVFGCNFYFGGFCCLSWGLCLGAIVILPSLFLSLCANLMFVVVVPDGWLSLHGCI